MKRKNNKSHETLDIVEREQQFRKHNSEELFDSLTHKQFYQKNRNCILDESSLKNKNGTNKQENILKSEKKIMLNRAVFTIVFVCIIAIICVAINRQNKNAQTELAERQAETMQDLEGQELTKISQTQGESTAKALTAITTRTPNTDNFTYVTSLDGYQVPVPKGYVASPVDAERYRDGEYDILKKQEDLTFKSATTYYLDQTLTLASPESETYPWTYNTTAGAWQSENYHVANSTSKIETNTFTVANNGDVVRIVWSVCSQYDYNTDYAYYTITNTTTGATIGGTSTGIYSTVYGTLETNLAYRNNDIALDAGTYKVEVTYRKNGSYDIYLDRAYVKSINVYSISSSSSNPSINIGSAYDYAWSYNSTIGAWQSGNKGIKSSTSTIESNNFTVTETARIRINWSVECDKDNDYVYYTITNIETGAVVGGTSTKQSYISYISEDKLYFYNTDAKLEPGTYKIAIKFVKNNNSGRSGLDRAYLKSIKVCTQNATGNVETFKIGSGGFVIYEKNAGETDEQATEEIMADLNVAKTTRNQWVWVSIPNVEVSNMYHVTNGQIYGNRYTFSTTSNTYWTETWMTFEPALTQRYDLDNSYLKLYLEGISRADFLQEMREEFYEMLTSVKTYEGFYIGRYETGNLSSKVPVVRKGNSAICNVNWYLMYKKCKNLKGSNNAVQTGMIWGIQWDETLKWLVDTREKETKYIFNSRNWGNHSTRDQSGFGPGRQPTGSSESWKAMNVYDLSGNVAEQTMETEYDANTRNPNRRVVRGSNYYYYGSSLTQRHTNSNYYTHDCRPTDTGGTVGTRATMILK